MKREARRILLPTLEVTETTLPSDTNAIKIPLPKGGIYSEYYVRKKHDEFEQERIDKKPVWMGSKFNLYPVVLDKNGAPWAEANIYILSRIESSISPTMSTYASIADSLAAFRRFLDETEIDWTEFPSHKLKRPTYRYYSNLKLEIASGHLKASTAKRRMSAVISFYSWLKQEGTLYAKNFIDDDKLHFGALWQETKPESEGLSYIVNVLLSDDVLFGGHASWIKNKIIGSDGNISFDREKTLQQFKRGEIAYVETLLGGCTSTEVCKQPALKWINTDCLDNGCKNLVCSIPKLERVITAQEKLVNSLDKNLVEYRTEKADLDILTSARDRAIKINQNNGN